MIAICFYAELADSAGARRRSWTWKALAHPFEVDKILCVDEFPDLPRGSDFNDVEVYDSLSAMKSAYPSATYVHVEAEAGTNLADFTHPDPTGDVVYCFGRNAGGFKLDADQSVGEWVHIGCHHEEDSTDSIWADQAAAIVVSHRYFASLS